MRQMYWLDHAFHVLGHMLLLGYAGAMEREQQRRTGTQLGRDALAAA